MGVNNYLTMHQNSAKWVASLNGLCTNKQSKLCKKSNWVVQWSEGTSFRHRLLCVRVTAEERRTQSHLSPLDLSG